MESKYIFDIETDGLDPTKIHCLAVMDEEGNISSTTSYKNMRSFFSRPNITLIGHNITRYDIPAVEKILKIKVRAKLVDTLALSWYLFPERNRHGLEHWGEDLGISKPEISDWQNLSVEEYIHRCGEDVRINTLLWDKIEKVLYELYESKKEAWRLIAYLTYKMDCAREQEANKWKLDVAKVRDLLGNFIEERDSKIEELAKAMPKVPTFVVKTKPKKPYKMNGELSASGEAWFKLLEQEGLPDSHDEPVKYVKDWAEPNPSSTTQIKDWLFSLGWKPETFNYLRDKKTNEIRRIPQVQQEKAKGPGLCSSVKKLYDKEPRLELLDGLSILTHRIGFLEGLISNVDADGFVKAEIAGLTNTLRFKHRVLVNIPGANAKYGLDIRSCLIAPEGYVLCGSDASSLEDRTKQHYMYPYDPEYVKDMIKPDFDPHLDLALSANGIDLDLATKYKQADDEYSHSKEYALTKAIRHTYKQGNYACTYGAQPARISYTVGIPEADAKKIFDAYWKRNWSLIKIAEDQRIKVCNKTKWLYNPVSRFWYSLRHEKDVFSTLNQGTGVYCFDMWLKMVRETGLRIIGQFHDEFIGLVKKGDEDGVTQNIKKCIERVNKVLKLNRDLDCDIQFGDNYAQIH